MSFASPAFPWYFLPAVLARYLILPQTWRNGLLSAASLLFYVWGAGELVFLLLACMVVNFTAGILIDSVWAKEQAEKRRAMLIVAIVFDVAILATWK